MQRGVPQAACDDYPWLQCLLIMRMDVSFGACEDSMKALCKALWVNLVMLSSEKKTKEKCMLSSNHHASLLRRQPRADALITLSSTHAFTHSINRSLAHLYNTAG